MKFDKKEIKRLAASNMQYSTYDPVEAVIMAVETWLKKSGLCVVEDVKMPSKNQEGG